MTTQTSTTPTTSFDFSASLRDLAAAVTESDLTVRTTNAAAQPNAAAIALLKHGVMRLEQNAGADGLGGGKRYLNWYPDAAVTDWTAYNGQSLFVPCGYVRAYDPRNDWKHEAALNALERFVSGSVWGNGYFVATAPDTKLSNEFSTGRIGYVRRGYQDDVEVTLADGRTVTVILDYNPQPGEWVAVDYVMGAFVASDVVKAKYLHTVVGADGKPTGAKELRTNNTWWRLYVWAAVLSGVPVSVEVPVFKQDTQGLLQRAAWLVRSTTLSDAERQEANVTMERSIKAQIGARSAAAKAGRQVARAVATGEPVVVPTGAAIVNFMDSNAVYDFATAKTSQRLMVGVPGSAPFEVCLHDAPESPSGAARRHAMADMLIKMGAKVIRVY